MKPDKSVILAQRLIDVSNQLQAITDELKVLINAPAKVSKITASEERKAFYTNKLTAKKKSSI